MSALPDELELIHFNDEQYFNKRDNYKESKKPAKKPKNIGSKKNSAVTITGEPSATSNTQTRRRGRKRNREKVYCGMFETFYSKQNKLQDSGLECIQGFLLKRRKFPLKGFHKRYFVLQDGFLAYARSQAQIEKGKCLGQLDMGYSVVSMQAERLKIDIDAGDQSFVYHIKTFDAAHFAAWSSRLHLHSMYRRRQLAEGGGAAGAHRQHSQQEQEDINYVTSVSGWVTNSKEVVVEMKRGIESAQEGLECLSMYLSEAVDTMSQRSEHQAVDSQLMTSALSTSKSSGDISPPSSATPFVAADTPNKKKRFSKLRLSGIKKSNERPKSPQVATHQDSSAPHTLDYSVSEISRSWSNLSEPKVDSSIVHDDFLSAANQVYAQLSELVSTVERERKALEDVLEQETAVQMQQRILMNGLKSSLNKCQVQNADLRDSLARIRSIAAIGDSMQLADTLTHSQRAGSLQSRQPSSSLNRFDSFLSIPSSYSTTGDKFFDAPDEFLLPGGDTSEDEALTQNSDEEEDDEDEDENESEAEESGSHVAFVSRSPHQPSLLYPPEPHSDPSNCDVENDSRKVVQRTITSDRRKYLPHPEVRTGDVGLWSILRKNIGRDLSKLSMPISLNEPLSALQRLCEELHYTHLLDKAATLSDPCDRMVCVAAFAVSAYAPSVHRAKHKPFNPILGETFECIREDRGFKYIAEQVSHHPPVAACHCESPNFVFWQDARIKNKFWGKSMEVFPLGTVNVTLPKHNDHYTWNKVTACIHNLLSGQRWVENYGEVLIQNGTKCHCKLVFSRTRYWSSKRHEVSGTVYNEEGNPVRHLFGNWTEVLFCGDYDSKECIWRADPMPDHSDSHYGFTQFAIELNELTSPLAENLPSSDTRFRPDQRLLEEGKIDEAQAEKLRVEQLQREAKADREKQGVEWIPNFFSAKEDTETWTHLGNYWSQREKKFMDLTIPKLW